MKVKGVPFRNKDRNVWEPTWYTHKLEVFKQPLPDFLSQKPRDRDSISRFFIYERFFLLLFNKETLVI